MNSTARMVLIVILVLLLLGMLPVWPYSGGFGYYPVGGLGLVLIIVVVRSGGTYKVTKREIILSKGPSPLRPTRLRPRRRPPREGRSSTMRRSTSSPRTRSAGGSLSLTS